MTDRRTSKDKALGALLAHIGPDATPEKLALADKTATLTVYVEKLRRRKWSEGLDPLDEYALRLGGAQLVELAAQLGIALPSHRERMEARRPWRGADEQQQQGAD